MMVITGTLETVESPTVIVLARVSDAFEAPAMVMMAMPLTS